MKNQDRHYIIETNFGTYWAGYNTFVDQIRKAQLYNIPKRAHEAAKDAIKRANRFTAEGHKITSYRLIEVQLVKTEEFPWEVIRE